MATTVLFALRHKMTALLKRRQRSTDAQPAPVHPAAAGVVADHEEHEDNLEVRRMVGSAASAKRTHASAWLPGRNHRG